jgi:hypothetical protein
MYALINNGTVEIYPYSIGQFRKAHPNTSFPRNISDDTLLSFGVHRVYTATGPEISATQALVEGDIVLDQATNRWTQTWTFRNKTADELAAIDSENASNVRNARDSLLAETDWMALSDVTMSADMAVYRQALRDVTAQAGFPHTIDWPVRP